MTPRQARTFNQIAALVTGGTDTSDSWILIEENFVTIVNQRNGQPSTGKVVLSRADFQKFIRWYDKDQKTRKAK